ncbi:tetratricopeptide repeat protein [Sphingomonas sp. Leaf4]|uniref:tetratricopeptide repeat protein n=1 Tax=Sphingomonas sp. Leaf4 TaxID=2876553 RepID=UPI001E55EDEE|nr:tetratricopeptide repeat protein [Sphingomonas sp. Leaf4]
MALIAAALAAVPAYADVPRGNADGALSAYVRARAADDAGQVGVAAAGYAAALAAQPGDPVIAVRALREGLASGDLPLARRAGAVLRAADVAPADIELLAFADALVARDAAGQRAALVRLQGTPIAFLAPMMAAWTGAATPTEAEASGGAIARRYGAENRALLLLADRRTVTQGAAAVRALLGSDSRNLDLRFNAAQLLASAGERDAARALLAGSDPVLARAAATIGRGEKGDARFGVSRLYARMAGDLSAEGTEPLAILLARAALVLDPGYHRARLALADSLAREGASRAALAELSVIPPDDAFNPSAVALRIALLQRGGDTAAATQLARVQAATQPANIAAQRQYADLLLDTGQPREAAAAYAATIERAGAGAEWTLYLQRGAALDQAGDWAAARPMLARAVELGPDEPAALNYLGYADIEHGGDVRKATAMLERAHALSPKDPAIADSLGWAKFRQGDLAGALPLIEGAARQAPDDVEINEHLGDLYWAAGRRYEARYAWRAAAVSASEADAGRLANKVANGPAS